MAKIKLQLLRKITTAIAVTISIVGIISISRNQESIRLFLTDFVSGPGYKSRLLLLLITILNIKNFPLVWHYRMFHAIFKYMVHGTQIFTPTTTITTRSSQTTTTSSSTPTLFLPLITSTISPLWESDFNLHKSNSTYFTDLDVSRHHLVACLFRAGLQYLMENDHAVLDNEGKPAQGPRFLMLGSASCSFKREIGMYRRYEVWSRVLCWDRKWIYVVSHFVKMGTKRPRGYVLTAAGGKSVVNLNEDEDEKEKEGGEGSEGGKDGVQEGFGDVPDKAIYASGICRYVIKAGRMTVHPVLLLEASGLLPPRPGGWIESGGTDIKTPTSQEGNMQQDNNEWHWKRVEAENARGLKLAQHLDGLEGTHCEWSGSQWPALDKFTDLF